MKKVSKTKKNSCFNIIKDARDFLILFVGTSSIHGLNHIVAKGRHPTEKVLWFLIMVAAMWSALSLSLSTWTRFSQNPTVVSIERNYKDWRTDFPAVSICPQTKYEPDYTPIFVEKKYSHVEDKNSLEEFIENLANVTLIENVLKDGNPNIKPENYWKILDDIKLIFKYNVSNSNLETYNVLEMTKSFTEIGVCYVYNTAIAQYTSPECWKSKNCVFDPKILTFKGSPLDGDVFAQVMNMNSAYEMYIHGPWEVPDAALAAIPAENNSYKTLDLTAQSIYSTEATEELTISQRKCRLPGESNLAISPVYSYNLCRMDCRVKKMISMCNCVPHFYRFSGGQVKVCDFEGLKCVEKHREFFIKLRDPETEVKVQCDCVPSCNEVNYGIDTDNTMSWNLGTNLKWGLTKYPKLRLKRDILFGWSDLLVITRYPQSIRNKNDIDKNGLNGIIQGVIDFILLVLRTSSVHGLSHIAAKNRHPLETVVWIVSAICGLFGALWLCLSTMHRFQDNPTVISLERNHKDWNTTFPACTLCPENKLDDDIEQSLSKWFPNADNSSEAGHWIRQLAGSNYFTLSEIKENSQGIKPSYYLNAILDAKFHFSYIISNSNSDDAFLVTTFTELGLCYSYNSLVAIYNNPDYWMQNNFSFVEGKDLFKGNPLEGDTFAQIMEMNSGFQVFIHSPYEVADIASKSLTSPPKFYMALDLDALSTYSTEQTKSLSISQRKCRFLEESNLKLSPAYTYNQCRIECRVKLAYKLCGCVPYFYRKIGLKICDVKGMHCLGNHKDKLVKLVHEGVKEKCQCVPPCNDVNYFVHGDSLSPWFLGTNLKYGLVKYPRSRLKRDVFFTFSDLLVQFGGTVGLCLGCSVLSCFEFIYFFTLRLFLFTSHRIKGSNRKRINHRPRH